MSAEELTGARCKERPQNDVVLTIDNDDNNDNKDGDCDGDGDGDDHDDEDEDDDRTPIYNSLHTPAIYQTSDVVRVITDVHVHDAFHAFVQSTYAIHVRLCFYIMLYIQTISSDD